jgi:photosystem II stability/assembly factor-like uncharacterized protein
MHPSPASSRASRGTIVIAAAVVTIVVAGIIYLRTSASPPPANAGPSNFPTLTGPYAATYDFLNPSLGWAIVVDDSTLFTRFWIFKTEDGAGRWQQVYTGAADGARIYIHFFDKLHGFAYAGYLYRTADGGSTWQRLQVPGGALFVTFASAKLGWVLGFGTGFQQMFRTTDGGDSWTQVASDLRANAIVDTIFDAPSSTFRDSTEGWLAAGRTPVPSVYRTLDGGVTWAPIEVPFPNGGTPDLGYVTWVRLVPGGGVVVMVEDVFGRELGAYLSTDQGASWQPRTFPATQVASSDISFIDATHWWVLRTGKVYRSTDAGRSWTTVQATGLPAFWSYLSARVIDGRNAWWAVVSQENSSRTALALTSDGGAHWTMHNMPQPAGGNV